MITADQVLNELAAMPLDDVCRFADYLQRAAERRDCGPIDAGIIAAAIALYRDEEKRKLQAERQP